MYCMCVCVYYYIIGLYIIARHTVFAYLEKRLLYKYIYLKRRAISLTDGLQHRYFQIVCQMRD